MPSHLLILGSTPEAAEVATADAALGWIDHTLDGSAIRLRSTQ